MARLHPFTAVRNGLTYAIQVGSFGFFAAVMAQSVDAVPVTAAFVLAPLAALAGVGYAVADYYVFEYDLRPEALHIRKCVIRR
ncbi:MAG: hypothetical protein V5A37_01125, partial [Halobacteriales archaeon]